MQIKQRARRGGPDRGTLNEGEGSCQTYQHQQTGAVSDPSGAVSTWAILCSLVPDGLGLAARSGQLLWSPNVEGRRS